MEEHKKESLINPINNQPVDEAISEAEANRRGYLTFEFLMRYLEDENEYVKYFVIEGKKVIVHLAGSSLKQYKKKPALNHERLLQENQEKKEANQLPTLPVNSSCNLDDEGCLTCGS